MLAGGGCRGWLAPRGGRGPGNTRLPSDGDGLKIQFTAPNLRHIGGAPGGGQARAKKKVHFTQVEIRGAGTRHGPTGGGVARHGDLPQSPIPVTGVGDDFVSQVNRQISPQAGKLQAGRPIGAGGHAQTVEFHAAFDGSAHGWIVERRDRDGIAWHHLEWSREIHMPGGTRLLAPPAIQEQDGGLNADFGRVWTGRQRHRGGGRFTQT
jgi:hypothetical protein